MERQQSTAGRNLYWATAALLVLAPIFRASNRPLPLLTLELLSLATLLLLVYQGNFFKSGQRLPVIVFLLLLASTALYLLPLPLAVWERLPGRESYLQLLQLLELDQAYSVKSISLIGQKTEAALWALLPAFAVFVAVLNLPRAEIQKLVYLVIGIAAIQSILGLMQYGGGPDSLLHLGNPYASSSASGTYASRDHLAGFLEMVFPVVLALLAAHVGQGRRAGSRRARWRGRIAFFSSLKGHRFALYAIVAVLLILALIFTRSRTGVGLAMIGLLLALFAFARRLGGSNVYGTMGTVIALIAVLALEIGLAPVLDRFSQDPLQDLRWRFASTMTEGIGAFFPIGSGQGTFPSVYPVYQPVDVAVFVNRAHNDYLEWIFDGGLLGLALIAVGLLLYLRQWPRLWISEKWHTFRFIQAGAGIGLFLMLLHTLVDFNLHIPANALFFAFFAAVFFRENHEERVHQRQRKQQPPPRPVTPVKPVLVAQDPDFSLDELDNLPR